MLPSWGFKMKKLGLAIASHFLSILPLQQHSYQTHLSSSAACSLTDGTHPTSSLVKCGPQHTSSVLQPAELLIQAAYAEHVCSSLFFRFFSVFRRSACTQQPGTVGKGKQLLRQVLSSQIPWDCQQVTERCYRNN